MQAVLRIWILWILTILASWIRIQGAKYQPKTAKKNFLLQNPNLNLWKKKDYTTFLISEWYINKQKQVIQNIWKFCVVKNSVNFKEITWIWIHFFPVRIQTRIRIKIKWILSTGCRTVLRTVNANFLPQLHDNYIKGIVHHWKISSLFCLKIISWSFFSSINPLSHLDRE